MILIATNTTIFSKAEEWNKIFEFVGYILAACAACSSMLYLITRVNIEDPLLYAFKEKIQKEMHVFRRVFFIIALGSILTLIINTLIVIFFLFFTFDKITVRDFYIMYSSSFLTLGLLCINFNYMIDKSIPIGFKKMYKNIILVIVIYIVCVSSNNKYNILSCILLGVITGWMIIIIISKYTDVNPNKILGALFLLSCFLCIPSYLFSFQIIPNAVILIITIICVTVYILYTNNVLDYSNRVNLSYVYYIDKKGNKYFLFDKIDDIWFVYKNKDYKKCSNKEKNEFYKKTQLYKKKSKVIDNVTNREAIIQYIDKINSYSEYFRINDSKINVCFDIIDEYIDNSNNLDTTKLDKIIRNLEKLVSFKCISNDELKNKTLHPYIDNKDRFYDMLKQI